MFSTAILAALVLGTTQSDVRIHSISDISHEFSFYMDGRFARQYNPDGADARNWGTLSKCDLTDANLLVLASGATACPYTEADVAAVQKFLNSGGGVVVLGSYQRFRNETGYRLNELATRFGAEFVDVTAQTPLIAQPSLKAEDVVLRGGGIIRLRDLSQWTILIKDANGETMLATRKIGKGTLLVGGRGLAGSRPDASDPINAAWWQPLLKQVASGKTVDPARPPKGGWAEHAVERDGITLEYTDYTKQYADAVFGMYQKIRPLQDKLLGVPPSKGNLARFLLLPTDGGGFSSGDRIGIAVWWGGFPDSQYGMAELIGHEATHSWVLPFAEPMWNEGLATYVGIQLGKMLGLEKDAQASLDNWISGAKKLDPDMNKLDIRGQASPAHVIAMAKPMWIWEQLKKEKPDILSRYFQAKRRLIQPGREGGYTADDCVAVLSVAMGRDLFGWFKSLGVDVDRSRTKVAAPN